MYTKCFFYSYVKYFEIFQSINIYSNLLCLVLTTIIPNVGYILNIKCTYYHFKIKIQTLSQIWLVTIPLTWLQSLILASKTALLFIFSFYLTYSPSQSPFIVSPLSLILFKCWVCPRLFPWNSVSLIQRWSHSVQWLKNHLSAETWQIYL